MKSLTEDLLLSPTLAALASKVERMLSHTLLVAAYQKADYRFDLCGIDCVRPLRGQSMMSLLVSTALVSQKKTLCLSISPLFFLSTELSNIILTKICD